MSDELLTDIAALAEELCDPTQHTERIFTWTVSRNKKLLREHTTIQKGLIEQLRQAINGPTANDDKGRRTIPASRPPLQLEALARYIDIEISANEWIHQTRTPHRGNLESNIRALVGTAANLPEDQRRQLLTDLRRWRSWAAVMSGWALPPYQPHVVCPVDDCQQLGTIRVIVERRTGLCVACGAIWDERDGSINLLAEYIRQESSQTPQRVPVGSTVEGHGGWTERRSP